MNAPLVIALVGHSNVGKTSLVSALARDASLVVAEEPGTTRVVLRRTVELGGRPLIDFVDTPGFELAGRIIARLDAQPSPEDPRTRLERWLAEDHDVELALEREALRGALLADLLAYVADASVAPTGQQRQELRLLRRAGVPIIGVLNVLREGADERAAWVDALRREGIDAIVPLDALAFPAEQEEHFWRALSVLHPDRAQDWQALAQVRDRLEAAHRAAAARLIAELIVDAAAFRLRVPAPTQEAARQTRPEANRRFQEALRQHEQRTLERLAGELGFPGIPLRGGTLPVASWSGTVLGDLFDADQRRRYGVAIGTAAVAGAVAGHFVDAAGGLGLGTALGAAAGAATGWLAGRRNSTSIQGSDVVVGPVDVVQFPAILLGRADEVWRALAGRSRADRREVVVRAASLSPPQATELARLASRARRHPQWSGVSGPPADDPDRAALVERLAGVVAERLGRR